MSCGGSVARRACAGARDERRPPCTSDYAGVLASRHGRHRCGGDSMKRLWQFVSTFLGAVACWQAGTIALACHPDIVCNAPCTTVYGSAFLCCYWSGLHCCEYSCVDVTCQGNSSCAGPKRDEFYIRFTSNPCH